MFELFQEKRVFEVARDLKVPTPDIIDFLARAGYDVTRKQMQPVTRDALLRVMHNFDRQRTIQYLMGQGIIGEMLKQKLAELDSAKANLPTPPKPEPAPKLLQKLLEAPKATDAPPSVAPPRPARQLFTKSKEASRFTPRTAAARALKQAEPTVKVWYREKPLVPIDPFTTTSSNPQALSTGHIDLELIRRLLALSVEGKQGVLQELRAAA